MSSLPFQDANFPMTSLWITFDNQRCMVSLPGSNMQTVEYTSTAGFNTLTILTSQTQITLTLPGTTVTYRAFETGELPATTSENAEITRNGELTTPQRQIRPRPLDFTPPTVPRQRRRLGNVWSRELSESEAIDLISPTTINTEWTANTEHLYQTPTSQGSTRAPSGPNSPSDSTPNSSPRNCSFMDHLTSERQPC